MLAVDPVKLEGEFASVVPLHVDHHDALAAASAEGDLWKLWYTSVPEPGQMAGEIKRRLTRFQNGEMMPFTVLDFEGSPAGMTTFCNIDAVTPRVEIGYTWYAKRVQRTAINTQCKRLLLGHAFDTWGCVAVEFRTAFFNRASRRAIERIGGKLDGILRSHRRYPNGSMRDTCVYSILNSEWPAVACHLDAILAGDVS